MIISLISALFAACEHVVVLEPVPVTVVPPYAALFLNVADSVRVMVFDVVTPLIVVPFEEAVTAPDEVLIPVKPLPALIEKVMTRVSAPPAVGVVVVELPEENVYVRVPFPGTVGFMVPPPAPMVP